LHRLAFTNARLSAFARCVFGRTGGQGRIPLLPSTLANTVPTVADLQSPCFVRLRDTAATHEIDIPTTDSLLVTSDLATFFTETFRILATGQIRTGREGAT
jgi:hypothetical protein